MGKQERLPKDVEHLSMDVTDLTLAECHDPAFAEVIDIDALKGSGLTIINGGDSPDAVKFHNPEGRIIPFVQAEADLSENEGTFVIKVLKRAKGMGEDHGKEIAAFTVAAVLVGVGTRYVSKRRRK